jgi:hypothetical protein
MVIISFKSLISYKLHTFDDESRAQAVSMVASDSTIIVRLIEGVTSNRHQCRLLVTLYTSNRGIHYKLQVKTLTLHSFSTLFTT